MNRKILAIAIVFTIPIVAQADIKVSGTIQTEIGNGKTGKYVDNMADPLVSKSSITIQGDVAGAIYNGGNNKLRFDIDEKIGTGLIAFGRYDVAFNTANNTGLTLRRETFFGLKSDTVSARLGTIQGAYKNSLPIVDPLAGTFLSAHGTGGGMTGIIAPNYYGWRRTSNGSILVNSKGNPIASNGTLYTPAACKKNLTPSPMQLGQFTHHNFVDNVLEVSAKSGGFSAQLQGVVDQANCMKGAGLFELKFDSTHWGVFMAGAYTHFDNDPQDRKKQGNLKVGGIYKLVMGDNMLILAGQYERAKIGTLDYDVDTESKGGQYGLVSADYRMGNVGISAWIGGYKAKNKGGQLVNLLNKQGIIIGTDTLPGEDTFSVALGAKYFFSKRTVVYGGYRSTNSKNDIRDEHVVGLGMQHDF